MVVAVVNVVAAVVVVCTTASRIMDDSSNCELVLCNSSTQYQVK